MVMAVYYIDCDDGFSGIYMIQELSRLCTLNMYSLLYVSYTSVRQLNFDFNEEVCLQRRPERQSNKGSVRLKTCVCVGGGGVFCFVFKNSFIR